MTDSNNRPRRPRRSKTQERFPVATIAYYGPNDTFASKVAVGIITQSSGMVHDMRKWVSATVDVRENEIIQDGIRAFVRDHRAVSVIVSDRIIGCPHEEGEDYPINETCPICHFWRNRDRWTGKIIDSD